MDDLKKLETNIKALVVLGCLKKKGPIYLGDLIRDYRSLNEENIPFRKYNFTSVESLVQSLPSLRLCGSGQDAMVEAAASSKSAHVQDLIAKQKRSKKPTAFHSSSRGRGSYSRGGHRGSSYSGSRGYSSSGNYRPPPRTNREYEPQLPPRFQNIPQARFQATRENKENSDYRGPESWKAMADKYVNKESKYDDVDDIEPTLSKSVPAQRNLPPRLQARRENNAYSSNMGYSQNMDTLVVKVNRNDTRQVSYFESAANDEQISLTSTDYSEQPSRLRKARQSAERSVRLNVSKANEVLIKHLPQEVNFETDSTSNNAITSPLGPMQLIAAGMANLQVNDPIQTDVDFLLQDPPTNFQPQIYNNEDDKELKEYLLQDPSEIERGISLMEPWSEGNERKTVVVSEEPFSLVPTPDEKDITNNTTLLLKYAIKRCWNTPEFHISQRHPKGQGTIFTATVKVFRSDGSSNKYSSYPNEDTSASRAKGFAAKRALEELNKEETIMHKEEIISTDKQKIQYRVAEIVHGYFNGLFAKKVEDIYLEKFNETLPSDWIKLVEDCNAVAVEPTYSSFIILPNDPSLIKLVSENVVGPSEITLPEDDEWFVHVTHVSATDSVWFRIFGEQYIDLYEDLTIRMDSYYKNEGVYQFASEIKKNHFYTVLHKDSSIDLPQRALVTAVDKASETATAWLVDHGEHVDLPFSAFYHLPPEFCDLPKQAVRCVMEGLELYSKEDEALFTLLDRLYDKALVAKISSRSQNEGFVSAILFDTSSEEDDINLNKALLDVLLVTVKACPCLPEVGDGPIEAEVTNVSKRGEIYIQIPSPCFEYIKNTLIDIPEEEIAQHKLTSFRQVLKNEIYLARYSSDGLWYRAMVTATPSVTLNKIPVRFIDYGNAESVSISDMADINSILPTIAKLPPQAMKVGLHKLPSETLTNKEIDKLQSLLIYQNVLIKVIDKNPPTVDMFYQDELDNNALTSTTYSILSKRIPVLKDSADNLLIPVPDGNSAEDGSLPLPTFPDVEYFVLVLLYACNPQNFFFTPVHCRDEQNKLYEEMNEYYDSTDSFRPEVSQDQIVKGSVYAAYCNDGWQRVSVVDDKFIESKVPVLFCDQGEIGSVEISCLKHLASKFREYPFYALKGKLAGVSPKHFDWSVEDCLKFNDFVGKGLCGKIISVENHSSDCFETVFSLKLIDTSTAEDINIADVLISEGRAVSVPLQ